MSTTQPACTTGLARFSHGDSFTPTGSDPMLMIESAGNTEISASIYLEATLTEGDSRTFTGWLTTPGTGFCFAPRSALTDFGQLTVHRNGRFTFTLDNDSNAMRDLHQGTSTMERFSVRLGEFTDSEYGVLNQYLVLRVTINGVGEPTSGLQTQAGNDGDDAAEFFSQAPSYYQTLMPQLEMANTVL